jgi:hypothetical protein
MPTNNLSWSPAGGAVTSQKIKRGTDPSPTTVLATVGATANTYADTTAQEKNDYYYVVESICANGDALSNEVTICNDGDVSAPVCFGSVTFDDTNSPYSGFTEDNYLGNIYGGAYSGGNPNAHHLVAYNPNIPSYPFTAMTCSSYNSTNYPYGYCDGIFGAYNVDANQLPGNYSGVYFYIGLGVERSSDGGTTKEVIGQVDPSTDAVIRTVATPNESQSNDFATCNCSEGAAYSYINSASQTINFRPTGTDSIYYTLFPVIDANISPVRISYSTITGDDDYGNTCSTGIRGRMRALVGVTESGVNYDFSGVQPSGPNVGGLTIYDTGWEQNAWDVTGRTTAELRNKVLNASNNLYVTVDAYEALQYGQVTRVTVTYTVSGGTPISLGILNGPSFSGSTTNKNTQTYTISRSAGDFIRIKILCDSTSGGGGA